MHGSYCEFQDTVSPNVSYCIPADQHLSFHFIFILCQLFLFSIFLLKFLFLWGGAVTVDFIFKINRNQNYSHSNIENNQSTYLQNYTTQPSHN